MIEVGEYVKCKDGIIAKIINKSEEDYAERGNILYELDKETFDDTEGFGEISFYALPDQFIKHSKNIIDLIEEGDYVNGKEVKHIADFEGVIKPIRKVIFVDEHHLVPGETAENDEIKSIVTKESFKNIEYRLEENK